ncbi:MAG: hypothetical protein ACRDB1_09350, partial [Microcoleaceae cyanobacterium]
VKITEPHTDNWALVLPDASEPLVHIYANSNDREWVDKTIREYRTMINDFVNLSMAGNEMSEIL